MKLKEKKQALEAEIQEKVQRFQNIEGMRNNLANEITEMRGKLQMLDELIAESEESTKELTKEKPVK